jgi:polyisoprenoid-binding protein YceI
VSIPSGTHRLGPDNATLSVRTQRQGAAAKAGHDLLIRVNSWEAQLVVADETSIELTADSTSLHVLEGTGGVQSLDEEDVASIETTIDDEVLKREDIRFVSSNVTEDGDRMHAEGELTLVDATRPIGFDVRFGDDGALTASAVVKQTEWGMKPYTALWGALKVADDVEVVLEGHLREAQSR